MTTSRCTISKSASPSAPSASAEVSYTRKLLDRGVAQCAKKLGEEAVETVLAAVGEDRERLIGEAADLLYHLLVRAARARRHAGRGRGRRSAQRTARIGPRREGVAQGRLSA